jgi:hypothetical protein
LLLSGTRERGRDPTFELRPSRCTRSLSLVADADCSLSTARANGALANPPRPGLLLPPLHQFPQLLRLLPRRSGSAERAIGTVGHRTSYVTVHFWTLKRRSLFSPNSRRRIVLLCAQHHWPAQGPHTSERCSPLPFRWCVVLLLNASSLSSLFGIDPVEFPQAIMTAWDNEERRSWCSLA